MTSPGDPAAAPLLSICIPTRNRAQRLRVALEAVVPQIRSRPHEVELWISDNASTDATAEVIAAAGPADLVNSARNDRDIGAIANFIHAATSLARGRYVWLIGDDDVLRPGAVERVMAAIRASAEVDAIYVNFRIASHRDHWPESAHGGWDGPFDRAANPDLVDRPLNRWADTLAPESSLGTQVYAHVVRRRLWLDYWAGRAVGELYSEPRWTWPHSYMLLETVFDRPSYYVGEPVLTMFNGGSSWVEFSATVGLLRLPEYVRDLIRRRLPAEPLRRYLARTIWSYQDHIEEILRSGPSPGTPGIARILRHNWALPAAWKTVLFAASRVHPERWWARLVQAAAGR
jgi:glycosyltransferase involved in cell wall biosynthesis